MVPHACFEITEPSQVGQARRAAARLAAELAFDEVTAGRVALVVTELGTNLARHAQRGRLLLAAVGAPCGGPCLEVISMDHGPGIADIGHSLLDGVSTGGTPGTGLGAVQRLADRFSAYSLPGRGTVIATRIATRDVAGHPQWPADTGYCAAGIALAAPGELVCGDGWRLRVDDGIAQLMVVDGLGHGPFAAAAADAALPVFEAATGQSPAQTLQRAHAALHGTRGAAGAVARLSAADGTLVFAGAGNIAGRLLSGIGERSLLSQHGTLGLQVRRLQDVDYAWPAHALLVLHSDGITSRWSLSDVPGLLQCDPAVIAAWILRDHGRGRDDATVVVVRRS